jgi:hypothetical protein
LLASRRRYLDPLHLGQRKREAAPTRSQCRVLEGPALIRSLAAMCRFLASWACSREKLGSAK